MKRHLLPTALIGAACLLATASAGAHVGVAGPAFANKTQVLNFSVGHGCEGADTYRLEVLIPPSVSSVRAVPSADFPKLELIRDAAGAVTAVAWEKQASVRAADELYYPFSLRIRVPDAPFTTLVFPAIQYCRTVDGEELVTEWVATPEEMAAAPAGSTLEPAPWLTILPPRVAGWNKFVVPTALKDLAIFADALIVWDGHEAYSANPHTMQLIRDDDKAVELSSIRAGDEVWVKY